jgi:hypothetical protein
LLASFFAFFSLAFFPLFAQAFLPLFAFLRLAFLA